MGRRLFPLLALALTLAPGCALPFRGTTAEVTIRCTDVPGARLRVDGVLVRPGTLELKRGDDHTVLLEAPGYRRLQRTIKSVPAYDWLIPEAIVAFLSTSIPLVVDAITGAVFDLDPATLDLTLVADDSDTTPRVEPGGAASSR